MRKNSILPILRSRIIFPICLIFLTVTFNNALAQPWQKLDTTNGYVLNLVLNPEETDEIIVASNLYDIGLQKKNPRFFSFGNGYRKSTDRGETWLETKLDSFTVTDIVHNPTVPSIKYASVVRSARGSVLKSTDGGDTWDVDNLLCESSNFIMTLVSADETGDKYYGAAINTGEGFMKTENAFEDCNFSTKINIQARDIEVSKADPNLMFIAGDNVYTGGVLRSYDGGRTWIKDSSGIEDLRILCVKPSAVTPSLVFCGADTLDNQGNSYGKGIYRSLDTGKTWQLWGAKDASVYDIEEHPSKPKYMAAACGRHGVFASANAGAYWEAFNNGLPEDSSCRHVAIPDWETNELGFLTYASVLGDGLYLSGRLITAIDELSFDKPGKIEIIKKYPNPFTDRINIIWRCDRARTVTITVSDGLGRKIYEHTDNYFKGDNVFEWSPDMNLASGVYMVTFISELGTTTTKLIKTGE